MSTAEIMEPRAYESCWYGGVNTLYPHLVANIKPTFSLALLFLYNTLLSLQIPKVTKNSNMTLESSSFLFKTKKAVYNDYVLGERLGYLPTLSIRYTTS